MTVDILNDTELSAVQRRFDERDRRWGMSCAVMFGVISGITFIAAAVNVQLRTTRLICAVIELLVSAAVLAMFWFAPRLYARAVRPIVIIYFVLMYAVVVISSAASSQWIAWAFILTPFLIGFRLFLSELAAIHIAMFAIALLYGQLVWNAHSANQRRSAYLTIGFVQAGVLLINAIGSRATRREVVSTWRERRGSMLEQLRIRDELQLARTVQLSMLPDAPPRLGWVDVAGISLPASEVGGDYFDYFPIGGALAIVCGDVAGHGLASGIVLSALRSGFILLREALPNPAGVLQRLNTMIIESSRHRTLVTAAILLLDQNSRQATITSAGHPPLIVRRANGDTDVVEMYGPPLGARLPHTMEERKIAFTTGDIFVMHSDGIHETRDAHGDAYGMERLIATIAAADGTNAEVVRDAIISDAERFRGAVPQADDATVVVARIV
jgi:stage II sporulation SpoE-like protein